MKIAANMTTDEIAAETRRIADAHPKLVGVVQPAADQFARILTERLPGISPADIAAVLLHTGSYLATIAMVYETGPISTVMASNIVALAGEGLHRDTAQTETQENAAANEALKQARWQYGRKARESFRTFVDGDGEEI